MTGPDERPPAHVRFGNRALVLVEDVVYVAIATLLSCAAAVVLYRAATTLRDRAGETQADGMVDVLDTLLLVFIFVELLYAVRVTLKERQIVAEPFLIAGILVSIKEIIVLAVKSPGDYLSKGPEFARAMVEIGLLAGVVVALSGAAVVLRRKEREPEENANTDPG